MYLFRIQVCYLIGYIKALIPKSFFTFQLLQDDERLQIFVQRASELGLLSFARLVGRKDTQSLKLAWLILYSELQMGILAHLEGNNNRQNENT